MRTGHVMQGSKKVEGVAALARPLHVGFDGRKVRNRRGWRGSIGVATQCLQHALLYVFDPSNIRGARLRRRGVSLSEWFFGIDWFSASASTRFDCSSVPSFAFSNARWCNELKKNQ
jgi:hypothetical protein